jgi:hypothetical protein
MKILIRGIEVVEGGRDEHDGGVGGIKRIKVVKGWSGRVTEEETWWELLV